MDSSGGGGQQGAAEAVAALGGPAALLRSVLSALGEHIAVLDSDQRVVHLDAPLLDVVHVPVTGEVEGHTIDEVTFEVVDPDGRPLARDEWPGVRAMTEGKPVWCAPTGIRSPSGALQWVLVSALPVKDDAGKVLGVVLGVADGTDEVVELRRRRHAEAMVDEAQRAAGLGSWEWDAPSDSIAASAGLHRILGTDPAVPIRAEHLQQLIHPEDRDRLEAEVVRAFLQGAAFRANVRIVLADDRVRHLRTWGKAVLAPHGAPIRAWGIVQDITPQRLEQERLLVLARTDPLTGLANRAGIEAEWRRLGADRRSQGLALVLLDIDRFKVLNDRHGHPVGDQVLVEVASRLRVAARAQDVVGRLGGDEFLVVLPDVAEEDVEALCHRMQDAVGGAPVETAAGLVEVHATAGASWVAAAVGLATAMTSADRALLEAKGSGSRSGTRGREADLE